MILARGNHEILRNGMLQHEPHALHIILGITPVAPGVQVAQVEFVLHSHLDAAGTEGDLARDEILAAALALVVEQDTVSTEHAVALAVVLHDPERVQLGAAVGAAGVERCGLALGNLLHLAIELTRAGLIDTGRLLAPCDAYSLNQAQGAHGIGLGRVFGHVK